MDRKFKIKDKVSVNGNKAVVIDVLKNKQYRVKFDNIFLIPPEMDVEEDNLVFSDPNRERCPFCKEKWKITQFNRQIWRDCVKCKKTAEELIDIYENDNYQSGGYDNLTVPINTDYLDDDWDLF